MKRFLLLWIAGASLIAFVLGSVNVPRLYSLTRRGAATCGSVTALEPNNHQTVRYSYQVNGQTYAGAQQGTDIGVLKTFSSQCEEFVHYLPENPAISCFGDPAPMLSNELTFIALAMLIFPSVALFGWRWRFPAFRRWLDATEESSSKNPPLTSI
jgi:hypothetical protein